MASTLPNVPAIPCAFAANGNKNTIPDTYIGSGGTASFNAGFPPETELPISGGGIPPSRLDMNGALNVATFPQYYLQMGGYYTFDANVADKIGGYPLGAILTYFDSTNKVVRKLRSKKANNYDNFIVSSGYIGTSWEDVTPAIQTGLPLFATFWALATSVPRGAVPLNGQWLSQVDYPDFYAAAVTEAAASNIPTITSVAYEQEIASNGQCGKFVIDTANLRVRIPTVKPHSFIENATSGATISGGATIGTTHNPGLPNISGNIFNAHTGAHGSVGSANGAFTTTATGNFGVDNNNFCKYTTVNLNASRSNAIYGNANTVQPQSVEMRLFMQVIKPEYTLGGGGSGGGITSAEAEQIASGATVNILADGGYATSANAESIASSVVNAGGYLTSDGGEITGTLIVSSGGKLIAPNDDVPGQAEIGVVSTLNSDTSAYMSAVNNGEDTHSAFVVCTPGNVIMSAYDVQTVPPINGALYFTNSGLVFSDGNTSGAYLVALQLATSTVASGGSVVFDEMPSGVSYVYTQPLTVFGASSIASDCRAEFDFTAASGATLAFASGAGIKLIGASSLDSGTHYIVAVDGARVVVNSYTVVGE